MPEFSRAVKEQEETSLKNEKTERLLKRRKERIQEKLNETRRKKESAKEETIHTSKSGLKKILEVKEEVLVLPVQIPPEKRLRPNTMLLLSPLRTCKSYLL